MNFGFAARHAWLWQRVASEGRVSRPARVQQAVTRSIRTTPAASAVLHVVQVHLFNSETGAGTTAGRRGYSLPLATGCTPY
jgi:hypothetical protein